MPELPEVETIRRGLSKICVRRFFKRVDILVPKIFSVSMTDADGYLIGAAINGVWRRGKALIIDLDNNYSLVVHLKMTGQLVFVGEQKFGGGHPTASLVGELPDRSTRVVFEFVDGSKLFFNDQRKFGWIRLVPTPEVENIEFFRKIGPEPLSANFAADDFVVRMRRRSGSVVKAVLLDQSVVAGIGNIYADESLWAAQIHPATRVRNISDGELRLLFEELRKVLRLSIEKGGSTDKYYIDAEGRRGSYLTFANVFRREGQDCPRCGAEIVKTRVAGRGTHICEKCQVVIGDR